METTTLKIPGVLALFKQALRMYRANFWSYLTLTIIPVIAAFVIAVALSIGLISFIFTGIYDYSQVMGIILLLISVSVLVSIVAVAVYLQLLTTMALVVQRRDGGKYTIRQALRQARVYIKRYFFVSVLSGSAVLGAGSVFLLPTLIGLGLLSRVIDFDPLIPDVGYGVGLVVAWLMIGLLIVPAIVVGVWLSMSTFVIVNETPKDTAMAVLLRSQQMVSGRWWAVFGRTLAPAFIFLLISLLTSDSDPSTTSTLEMIGQFVTVVLSPLVMLYLFELYTHLNTTASALIDEARARKIYNVLVWVGGVVFVVMIVSFILVTRN